MGCERVRGRLAGSPDPKWLFLRSRSSNDMKHKALLCTRCALNKRLDGEIFNRLEVVGSNNTADPRKAQRGMVLSTSVILLKDAIFSVKLQFRQYDTITAHRFRSDVGSE